MTRGRHGQGCNELKSGGLQAAASRGQGSSPQAVNEAAGQGPAGAALAVPPSPLPAKKPGFSQSKCASLGGEGAGIPDPGVLCALCVSEAGAGDSIRSRGTWDAASRRAFPRVAVPLFPVTLHRFPPVCARCARGALVSFVLSYFPCRSACGPGSVRGDLSGAGTAGEQARVERPLCRVGRQAVPFLNELGSQPLQNAALSFWRKVN